MKSTIAWFLGMFWCVLVAGVTTVSKQCYEDVYSDGDNGSLLVISASSYMTELVKNATRELNNKGNFKLGLRIFSSDCPEIEVEYKLWQSGRQPCERTNKSCMIGMFIHHGAIGSDNEKFKRAVRGSGVPYIVVGEIKASSQQSIENEFVAGVEMLERAKAIAELAVLWNWDYTTILCGDDEESTNLLPLLQYQLVSNAVCYEQVNFNSQNLSQAVGGAARNSKGVIVLGEVSEVNSSQLTGDNTWVFANSPRGFKSLPGNGSVFVLSSSESISSGTIFPEHLKLALKLVFKATQLNATSSRLQLNESELTATYTSNAKFENGSLVTQSNLPSFFLLKANFSNHTVAKYSKKWAQTVRDFSCKDVDCWCIKETCRKKCLKQNPPKNFYFVDGDYILVVTSPTHDTFGPEPDLYKCSRFNSETAMRTQAAIFARKRLKELLGIDFGLLVLDTCYNEALAQFYMADILHGTTPYCFGGKCLNRTKIVGVIGDFISHVAVAEQRMLMPAGLLQVSYGSATDELDNKTEFTNFLRVHNGNTRVVNNIVQLLDELKTKQKAEINSVVVVHSDTLYGRSGGRQLELVLNEHNYCTRNILIDPPYQLTYAAEYSTVKKKYKDFWVALSKTVKHSIIIVYIGEEKAIKDFLRPLMEDDKLKNWWLDSGSIFIMAEIWEDRQSLLNEYGKLLRGSLSFKMLPHFKVDGFKRHLSELRPNAISVEQMFNRLYEEKKECKIRGDFNTKYSKSCNNSRLEIAGISEMKEAKQQLTVDIYTTNLIKAVYAFGYGFRSFKDDILLDRNKKYSLSHFRNTTNKNRLKRKIKDVEIPADDQSEERSSFDVFDCNLDGTGGYEVFSQQWADDELKYVKVFTFEKQNFGEPDLMKTNKPVMFYKLDQGQDTPRNTLKAYHCQNCACPVLPPAQWKIETILLAIGFGVVSFILLGILAQKIFKKIGCRKELPQAVTEEASPNSDSESNDGESSNSEGENAGGHPAEESIHEDDERPQSVGSPDDSLTIHIDPPSRSPSIDTGCGGSVVDGEIHAYDYPEPVKPRMLHGPGSATTGAPVPKPRVRKLTCPTEYIL